MRKTIFQQKEAEVLNGNFINWDVPLLGSNSYKVKKGEKYGWKTYIMYMAPHTLNSKGINLCPKASEGCMATCLFTAGRGGYSNVMLSRRNKSNMFVADKQRFMNKLVDELMVIERKQNKANERFAVRLNGTTDISFEKIKIDSHGKKTIYELFPNIQFYDYTKVENRIERKLAMGIDNLHLTFSRSEANEDVVKNILKQGINVAVVFDEVPNEYLGFKVIDGDDSDLTFTYESGVVVGLKFKRSIAKGANNKQIGNNFIVRYKQVA